MAKVGDIVRYLNSVGGGRIVRIEGQIAYVDEDGFENPVMLRECVVVAQGSAPQSQKTINAASPQLSQPPSKDASPMPKPETFVVEETPGGDSLNVVLAFEPVDIKRLSTTTFEAYLVNDSNYYLSFAFLSRASDSREWRLRHADVVEPGIQVFIGTITRDDLAELDHVALQFIAYKQDKPFEAKTPAFIDLRLDTTKFFKLHCFQPNMYFDYPVLALNMVTDDLPARQIDVCPQDLAEAMTSKDLPQQTRANNKRKKAQANEPLVIDLHIAELVDNTNGLSNSDMLNLQIDTFRKVMDANLKNHGKKIVFIHGKGEGVLRKAILKELNYRYKGHDVQDASFQEYGFGATQVKIK